MASAFRQPFRQARKRLLRDGLLRDAMKWPAASVEDLVDFGARDEPSRMRLVGMEMFLRLYAGGATVESLSEALHSVSSKAAAA